MKIANLLALCTGLLVVGCGEDSNPAGGGGNDPVNQTIKINDKISKKDTTGLRSDILKIMLLEEEDTTGFGAEMDIFLPLVNQGVVTGWDDFLGGDPTGPGTSDPGTNPGIDIYVQSLVATYGLETVLAAYQVSSLDEVKQKISEGGTITINPGTTDPVIDPTDPVIDPTDPVIDPIR